MLEIASDTAIPHAYSCDDYLALPRDPYVWLIDRLVPAGGALNLLGDSKVGKSFAALQLAASLAGGVGEDWLGFCVVETGPVLYVQLDTPRSLWMERLEKIRDAGTDLSNIYMADRESLDTWPFNIMDPSHASRLRAEIDRIKPVAVILDTLRELHAMRENESDDMKIMLSTLVNATKPAALILVSHTRKPNPERTDPITVAGRGSNYIASRMDALVQFSKHELSYTGRALESGKRHIERMENGLWRVGVSDWDLFLHGVLTNAGLTSVQQKAKELARLSGKKFDACKKAIYREIKEGGH